MPKRSDVRAAFDKALSHLSDEERKLIREAVGDAGRIFDLAGVMVETPTSDEGRRRLLSLRDEIRAIDQKWTHD